MKTAPLPFIILNHGLKSVSGLNKIKLAVFISGRGSNLQSIIDACKDKNFPAEISVVISNVPNVAGLDRAKKANIEHVVIDHTQYDSREKFEDALHRALRPYNVNVICLAGFMRVLTPHFIDKWPDRIINIHPSLLPKHKGLNTHQRAIDAGDEASGCTVHYVVPDIDSGATIVQKTVRIEDGDDAETLAARVLEKEHLAYPEAIRIIAAKLQQ